MNEHDSHLISEADTAMVKVEPKLELAMSRTPQVVLDESQEAANALMRIINAKPKKVSFNGETYLEFEDWQLVARFYQCTVRGVESKYVECGEAKGFEAVSEVLHIPTGQIIGRGEAMCLDDEEKWGSRPKYEWQNGQKVKVGEVKVPMFQLRSMAQTRAGAKALRNVFSSVVVLAGYRPTPAEEMTGEEAPRQSPPSKDRLTSIGDFQWLNDEKSSFVGTLNDVKNLTKFTVLLFHSGNDKTQSIIEITCRGDLAEKAAGFKGKKVVGDVKHNPKGDKVYINLQTIAESVKGQPVADEDIPF